MASMHKVFLSYHDANDAGYKQRLLELNEEHRIFVDGSVDTGDIDDTDLPDDRIREIIRDDYLADTTVTIVLVGTGTKGRKHVDWEIYSSMRDGAVNKKSGVFAILLPSAASTFFTAAHGEDEKKKVYPDYTEWTTITERAEYERRYEYMPSRIIDNLLAPKARVSVTNWNRIESDPEKLRFLIEATYRDRAACEYDLSTAMRRVNS